MVEAELSLFEVQIEGVPGDAVELRQEPLGVAPERLDAVDVRLKIGEFVIVVPHAQVLGVATDASDTLASDWELIGIEIREQ